MDKTKTAYQRCPNYLEWWTPPLLWRTVLDVTPDACTVLAQHDESSVWWYARPYGELYTSVVSLIRELTMCSQQKLLIERKKDYDMSLIFLSRNDYQSFFSLAFRTITFPDLSGLLSSAAVAISRSLSISAYISASGCAH
jgi:hypothetical protein